MRTTHQKKNSTNEKVLTTGLVLLTAGLAAMAFCIITRRKKLGDLSIPELKKQMAVHVAKGEPDDFMKAAKIRDLISLKQSAR